MIKYPRKRNGSIDTGLPARSTNSSTGSVCPACRNLSILESVSAESCISCGHIVFDYWPDAVHLPLEKSEVPILPL